MCVCVCVCVWTPEDMNVMRNLFYVKVEAPLPLIPVFWGKASPQKKSDGGRAHVGDGGEDGD